MRANTITIVVFLLLVGARVEAQGSLDAARNLYAAAEYDRALSMLDSLKGTERPREEQQAIELYRVLCLVATGKELDAKGAMESLITRHPLYRPADDLPPRVRSTYSETRKRLLPSAAQSAYQEAKTAFDVKDFSAAERGFSLVLAVIADPDVAALANTSPLADIRTLASGFRELSAKAATPPETVARVIPPPPAAPEWPSSTMQRMGRLYSSNDTNVVPPVVVNQQIPAYPGPIRIPQMGMIEVVIDTTGGVESATIVTSINPQYDRLALNAARLWQYQPAKVDGTPVKFVKRIQVSLVPRN